MSKQNKNKSEVINSSACAAFEDGINDFYTTTLSARDKQDGGKTPEAMLFDGAHNVLLRVGALTSKTKAAGKMTKAGVLAVVAEPFEVIDESIETDTLHVTLNFRNAIEDFYKVALVALVSGIAYAKTKLAAAGDDKAKPKRNGNKIQNEVFQSLGIERVKNAETEVWEYVIGPNSAAAGIIAEAQRTVPVFPAEALTFMGKEPTLPKSAFIVVNFGGVSDTIVHNSGPEKTIALVNGLLAAGVKVERVAYKDPVRLDAALTLAGDTAVRNLIFVHGEDMSVVETLALAQAA